VTSGATSAENPAVERIATILVVDDDPLVAMSAIDMVEDIGHRAIEVHSARQALEVLKTAQPVDLLMTDQTMPGMTGLELARLAQDLRPALPILLVTGNGDFTNGENTGWARLCKPYHQSQLEAEIDRLLSH
jgi:CheY-like chemotaxis protein